MDDRRLMQACVRNEISLQECGLGVAWDDVQVTFSAF